METRSKIILSVIAIFLIALALRNLDGVNHESDTVQIQNQLLAAAAAASNKDAHEVMAIISDNYSDDADNNPERLNIMLRRGMSNVQNLKVHVAPATVYVDGNIANSTSYLTIEADGQVIFSQLIHLEWAKEKTRRYFIIPDEVWRVVHSTYSGGLDGG